jgi:hypothetical protein
MIPASLLRKAASGYRDGDLEWGRLYYLSPATGCRCVLGALSWAVDPDVADDYSPIETATRANLSPEDARAVELAVAALADHVADELGDYCLTDGVPDLLETIGTWNDEPDTTLDVVLAALDAAADQASRTAVPA